MMSEEKMCIELSLENYMKLKYILDNYGEDSIELVKSLLMHYDKNIGKFRFYDEFLDVERFYDPITKKWIDNRPEYIVCEHMRWEVTHEYEIEDLGLVVTDNGYCILVTKPKRIKKDSDEDNLEYDRIYAILYIGKSYDKYRLKKEGIRIVFRSYRRCKEFIEKLEKCFIRDEDQKCETEKEYDKLKSIFFDELSNSKVFLHIIRMILKKDKYVFTIDELMEFMDYKSKPTTVRQISTLIKKGLIKKKGNIGKTRLYTLTIPRQVLEQWMKEWVGLD